MKRYHVVSALLVASAFRSAFALGPEEQYRKDLQAAESQVLRLRADGSSSTRRLSRLSSQALSPGAAPLFLGRYYRVGDQWDVLAWRTQNPLASPYTNPGGNGEINVAGPPGWFHYEVTDIRNGATPEVVIRVQQDATHGWAAVDPKVEALELRMDDRMAQSAKSYRFTDRSATVAVPINGIHSSASPLEFYPLDVPGPMTATVLAARELATALPPLPDTIRTAAVRYGWNPDLSSSYRVHQSDFFGRPVEMMWQQGDPWPFYLRTPGGVAILIKPSLSGSPGSQARPGTRSEE